MPPNARVKRRATRVRCNALFADAFVRSDTLNRKAGQLAALVIPDDPLVKPGDLYIMFLRLDKRENNLGMLLYGAVGYSTGKIQITAQGSVRVHSAAAAKLGEFDSSNVKVFVNEIEKRIKIYFGPWPVFRGITPGAPPVIPPTGPPTPPKS